MAKMRSKRASARTLNPEGEVISGPEPGVDALVEEDQKNKAVSFETAVSNLINKDLEPSTLWMVVLDNGFYPDVSQTVKEETLERLLLMKQVEDNENPQPQSKSKSDDNPQIQNTGSVDLGNGIVVDPAAHKAMREMAIKYYVTFGKNPYEASLVLMDEHPFSVYENQTPGFTEKFIRDTLKLDSRLAETVSDNWGVSSEPVDYKDWLVYGGIAVVVAGAGYLAYRYFTDDV